MDKPLTKWYCDVCGQPIETVKVGYVLWKTTDKLQPYDFKVIHKTKCDRKDYPASAALEDFLGEKGAANLLSFLSIGPVKRKLGDQSRCEPKNLDEFVDFFRRMQTPYYEEARRSFGNPDYLEYHSDDNEVGPYLPDTLKKTISKYGAER